jgi:SAM-dependent methyltransferase
LEIPLKKTVSESLDAEEILLPYMSYLLQDLWGLGSSFEQIIKIFESLTFSSGIVNILDLGCGKGAASVNIASKFGYKVTGIDAMHDFLIEANNYAKDYRVENLCDFKEADILNYTNSSHNFDAVILAALGGIFGSMKETIKILRSQVNSGGYIIIDDCYLKNDIPVNRKGYEHYKNYETTQRELLSAGDKIIIQVSTSEFRRNLNYEYLNLISSRCGELIEKHREIQSQLENYIHLQKEECDFLNSNVEGMIWVLQKSK